MSTNKKGQAAREHSPLTLAVADQVAAERGARRLSQTAAAQLAGMPYITYRRLENKQRVVTLPQLEQLAAGFGIKPEVLLAAARRRMNAGPGEPVEPAHTAKEEVRSGLSDEERLDIEAAALDVDAEVKRRSHRRVKKG